MTKLSVAQFRMLTQSNLEEPPIYRLPRLVSPYLSRPLVRLGVSPNAVTISWFACLLGAAVLLAINYVLPAIILISLFYVLDCVDGEIARARKKPSRLGSQLEQVCHWVSGGVLLSGAAWFHLVHLASPFNTVVFCAAIIGNYAFYFVFYQLMLLMTPGHNYGFLHPLAAIVFYLMPLEVNLVLLFAVVSDPWFAVVVWAVMSNAIAVGVFGLYYIGEIRRAS